MNYSNFNNKSGYQIIVLNDVQESNEPDKVIISFIDNIQYRVKHEMAQHYSKVITTKVVYFEKHSFRLSFIFTNIFQLGS